MTERVTRAAACKAIKGKPREQQMAYLMGLGLKKDDAEDFIDDYELRSARFEQLKQSGGESFSQSDTFKQMVEGFRERIYRKDG